MMRFIASLFFLILTLFTFAQQHKGKRLVAAKTTDTYTIYNCADNDGVVITAADDGQVIAYTDNGNIDLAMQNPVFRAMVENLGKTLPQKGGRNLRKTISKRLSASASHVAPLLTDKWHQYYEPYNLLAPKIDTTLCVSGCVASAMAQVMHFWRYPEHGYGSYTYVDSLGCGQTLTADFENHYYDWANMLDDYEGVKYSDAQGYAVAQLMYDCGVSVDMKYGVDASGAISVRQPLALSSYFGYDKSAQMHFRDFYSIDEWTRMFKEELDAGRPILVSGYNYRLGHAFVCDGYDENGFFHFSFGNPSGAGDGFFYLPYLTPDFPPSQDPNDPESGFNLLQSMVTHLLPSTHPDATGVENHVFAMSSMSVVGKDSIAVNNLGNVGWNLHNDSVALALVHNGEIASFPFVYDHDFLLEEFDDTVYTDTLCLQMKEPVADGVYKLLPMYKDNGSWKEVRASVGVPNYLIANVKDNSIVCAVDSANTSYLTLESYEFPDWLPASSKPDFTITLKNHNAEFCGRVYIMLENVIDSMPSYLIQEQGLTLMPDEVVTRHFHRTNRVIFPGTYNLLILYDHDLFSSDFEVFDEEPLKTVVVSDKRPEDSIAALKEDGTDDAHDDIYDVNGARISSVNQSTGIYIKNKKKYIAR